VEKEETFELAGAARDRFMFEIQMAVPEDAAIRKSLAFDPSFHDADALIARMAADVVPYRDLNGIAALIQREVRASDALQDYVLALWSATQKPSRFGIQIDGSGDELVLAGTSPRGVSQMLRAARVAAWLNNRDYLVPEDIQTVFHEAVAHRVFFNPVVELRRAEVAPVFTRMVLEKVAAP
jgi:MoxR-like ATPase